MERGPLALFGAIVAVGLGPALWLGAQFGNAAVPPGLPPAVVEANQDQKASGGAGSAPEDPVVEPTPKSKYVPLSGTPTARSSTSAPAAEPDDEPSATPEQTGPTPSEDPTVPPTEATTQPPESPGDGPDTEVPVPGDDDDPAPPAPDDPGTGAPGTGV